MPKGDHWNAAKCIQGEPSALQLEPDHDLGIPKTPKPHRESVDSKIIYLFRDTMVEEVADIKKCEHDTEELATYCRIHDIALCNDCYFDEHGGCGRGMTLK